MNQNKLKISGMAVCTVHEWLLEKNDQTTFPTIYFVPIAGRIPNKRIVPGFIGETQGLLPDLGDYFLMSYRVSKYIDEIGYEVEWTNAGRLISTELIQLKDQLGKPEIFLIEEPNLEVKRHVDCIETCNFPLCSEPGCMIIEKLRFEKQYQYYRHR